MVPSHLLKNKREKKIIEANLWGGRLVEISIYVFFSLCRSICHHHSTPPIFVLGAQNLHVPPIFTQQRKCTSYMFSSPCADRYATTTPPPFFLQNLHVSPPRHRLCRIFSLFFLQNPHVSPPEHRL